MNRGLSELLCRRYAKALFAIRAEEGKDAGIDRDLESLSQLFLQDAWLWGWLDSPLVSKQSRDAACEELGRLAGLSTFGVGLIRLLARRSRMHLLPGIIRQLGRLQDIAESTTRVGVTAAKELDGDDRTRLAALLKRLGVEKPVCTFETDGRLLGGCEIRIGDILIDGSVRGRLDRLKKHFLENTAP